jgi:hypothetical protein
MAEQRNGPHHHDPDADALVSAPSAPHTLDNP